MFPFFPSMAQKSVRNSLLRVRTWGTTFLNIYIHIHFKLCMVSLYEFCDLGVKILPLGLLPVSTDTWPNRPALTMMSQRSRQGL